MSPIHFYKTANRASCGKSLTRETLYHCNPDTVTCKACIRTVDYQTIRDKGMTRYPWESKGTEVASGNR